MKNNRLIIGLSAIMLLSLSACGKTSSTGNTDTGTDTGTITDTGTDTTPEPNQELKSALDSFGTNYTASFVVDETEDSWKPQLRIGEGFIEHCYESSFSGYAKIASDSEYYHAFEHNNPDIIYEWSGEYFDLKGRRDYTDADVVEDASLANYFNVANFEKVAEGVYHSDNEADITTYLNFVNTDFGYYMFGYGKGGININLTADGSVDKIVLLGYDGVGGGEGDIDLTATWATIEFSNLGTTTDEILTSYLEDLTELPELTFEDIRGISRDGKALYEGLEVPFEYMVPVGFVGDKYISLWSDAGYCSFLTSEFAPFGNVSDNLGIPANFDATISAVNGHVELKNIKNFEYQDDYIMSYPQECDNGGYWEEEFASKQWGPSYNGSLINITNLTFEGGSVSENAGTNDELRFSYTANGKKITINVRFDASLSEAARFYWNDFVENLNVKVGSAIDLCEVIMVWENGELVVYFGETSYANIGVSFSDACFNLCEEEVPMYTGNLGVEFFFDMNMPGDDEKMYQGLLAIIDVQEGKEGSLVSEYELELTTAGYTKANQFEEGEVVVTQFNKGDIVVLYTSAMTDTGDYYYYQVQVVNLAKEYVEPEQFSWVGTYDIVLADDTEITLTVQDDGFAYIGDEEFQWMSFGNLWVYNDAKEYTINYDEFADEYTGYDGAGDSFKSVVRY